MAIAAEKVDLIASAVLPRVPRASDCLKKELPRTCIFLLLMHASHLHLLTTSHHPSSGRRGAPSPVFRPESTPQADFCKRSIVLKLCKPFGNNGRRWTYSFLPYSVQKSPGIREMMDYYRVMGIDALDLKPRE